MDDSPGIKFGDLQNDQRYKRLERNLKLEYVKQIEKIKAGDKDYCSSPTWPSSSSIHPDGLDSSCANVVPSLQVSRVHSEVVSSSANLRNVLSMQRNIHTRKPMATSSVKKFPVSDVDNDRAMMPPPPIGDCIFRDIRRTANANSKYSPQDLEDYEANINIKTQDAPMKISDDSLETYHQIHNDLPKSDCQNSKAHRVFSRWRVIINDHGQLIIKGTLECGKVARSKPVIQRFSNTRVQSIYKHTYVLEGNIVDDRNELPDYIRGKFYNGFPDDWENIYQLWRNYIAEGCKITYRWPTPISDSDDDINSEITDFAYNKNKQTEFEQQVDFSKSLSNNGSSLGYHSKNQSDNQNLEKSKEKSIEDKTPEIHTENKKIDDSGHSSEKNISACECSKENCNKNVYSSGNNNSNSSLKNASYLYEIIHEDKLRIILSNLGNKNCAPQYLDKFLELVDVLRYMLSYTPNSNQEIDNNKQSLTPSKTESQGCQKCNRIASFSVTQETNAESKSNNVESETESINIDEIHQNTEKDERSQTEISYSKENYMQLQSKVSNSASNIVAESDNETYMGVAQIPLNHLIKSKISRCPRYRNIKCRGKDRRNINNDEEVNEELIGVQDRKLQNYYDSSVSITEDEYERKHLEKENKQTIKPVSSLVLKKNKGNIEVTNRNEANNEYINTKSYDVISTSSPSKTKQKTDKQKPVIKSNELVHLDLELKKLKRSKDRIPADSDVSVIDEASTIKQDLTKFNSKKNSIVNEKLSDNLLEHPFLTYDSEDFSMDEDKTNAETENQEKPSKAETEPKILSSSKLKKVSSNENKLGKSELFGSKENPKLLKSWVPCVMYDDEFREKYSLKFEGILLNEAEHVSDRKYISDFIQKRHSSKLLETVNNEYIMLVGEINNTKHIIPKELLRLCRTGCPARIKEFCEEWKKVKPVLEKSNSKVNLHEDSIDSLTVATSSRGRRIVPPLNYWNGERIKKVGYDTVYDPGNEYKVVPTRNEGSKKSKMLSPEKSSKDNYKKEASLNTGKNYVQPPDVEIPQKRIAEKLKYTSNSDSEKDEPRSKKALRKPKEPLNENLPAESQPHHLNVKLRKRQRVDYKENVELHRKSSDVKMRGSTRKSTTELTWIYTKRQPSQDVLSDDQASIIK